MDKGYVNSEYLAQLAAFLETIKQHTYERLQITQGSTVLDVGCGPGTDTIPLAKLVGPIGRVVGVDKDAAMIDEANARAQENGVAAWTEHRVADAAQLPFDDNTFDAVRSERLFQHLTNPSPTFREMVRVARPGGILLVLDTDYASASFSVDEHELERRFARVILEHSVNNGYAAREMPLLFQQHNLDDIDVEIIPVLYTNYSVARHLGRWDNIETIAQELDLLNRSEIEHLNAACQRAADAAAFIAHVNLILTIGRKPATQTA